MNPPMINIAGIRQGMQYVTNAQGERTALLLDLKNKAVKQLVEDLIDTLDAIDAYGDPRSSSEEVRKELLGS